jgi:hypothetical protein
MYSGTTLTPLKWFDAWFGAHQKIDRIALRHLALVCESPCDFPTRRQIAKFEGLDGPDGIKRKNPARDEPWHYIDPFDSNDRKISDIIQGHYDELVSALRDGNTIRAAFEAAWLSHAIVDGLTPAHHYPLRGGEGIETRTTIKDKLVMPGETLSKQLSNNWKMWGDKGLLATHFAFEWGVAAIIAPLRLGRSQPSALDLAEVNHSGIVEVFHARVRQIAELHMYDEFYKSGWTPRLAKQVRRELAPLIINTVTLAWYAAVVQSRQKVTA